MKLPFSFPYRFLAWPLAIGLPACLSACAGHARPDWHPAAIPDLDSLNRVVEYNDSVEANYFFYEDAFTAYKAKFPGVDKPAYMAVARGKDAAFCLFQPNPALICVDVGDKFKALGLEEPARDAYEAGLLSEGVNGDRLNIRLWSGMARLHLAWLQREQAKLYLTKVLEVDNKNGWARKMLASMNQESPAAEGAQKFAPAPKSEPGQYGNKRRSKAKPRGSRTSRIGDDGLSTSAARRISPHMAGPFAEGERSPSADVSAF